MTLSAEEAVRGFFEGYNARDADAVAELLAAEFVYEGLGERSKYEGKDRVVAYLEQALQLPDQRWEVDLMFSSGDRVAVESTYSCTLPAGLGPNKTGSPLPIRAKAAQIIDTKNGLLIRFTDYAHPDPEF